MRTLLVGLIGTTHLVACSPAPNATGVSPASSVELSGHRSEATGPDARPRSTPGAKNTATPAVGPATQPDAAGSAAGTSDPSVSTPDAWEPPPPREGAPGSTRGTISCGTQRCVAPGEVCKLDEAAKLWRCEPAPPRPDHIDRYDYAFPHVECDDGTDCPQGETCCLLWHGHAAEHASCVERAVVPHVCRAELCLEGGARCPPGRSCAEGVCEAPDGPATCSGKRRCPKEAPVCVKSTTAPGGFECAAKGSAAYAAVRGDDRYECTRQSDCNLGETCSYSFGEAEHETRTFCSLYHPAFMGSLLCEVGGPDFCDGDAECRASMTCAPQEGAPPWVGVWTSK
jgi:hypothetical protein